MSKEKILREQHLTVWVGRHKLRISIPVTFKDLRFLGERCERRRGSNSPGARCEE